MVVQREGEGFRVCGGRRQRPFLGSWAWTQADTLHLRFPQNMFQIFTGSAIRPIQSISYDVGLFVCLCVCALVKDTGSWAWTQFN